jgi:DNA invertase Pin-like site-specific DNA recombinase
MGAGNSIFNQSFAAVNQSFRAELMSNGAAKLTAEQIFKRAGGRRRYNLERQRAAEARLKEVERLLALYGAWRRGVRARIARELGVSRATVTRDVQVIELWAWARAHPAQALVRLWGDARPAEQMRLLSDLVSDALPELW